MKRLIILAFFLFLLCYHSTKSQPVIDSLVQELNELRESDRKEKLLLRIGTFSVLAVGLLIFVLGTGYKNRKKAEAAQIAASKDREFAMQREQLYVNVTHELRTPLTLIISPLEELARENSHPHVHTALRNARELEIRFNDILKWNKLEANAMSVLPTVGHFEEEIKKIVTKFRPLAEGKGVSLSYQPGAEEHRMELDFEKLQTILSNLLVNALKFTHRGDMIQVETAFFEKDRQSYLQVKVQDNGEDIPPELIPVIFERFRQGDQAKPNTVGAGIGLALAKELTLLMGGEISAASNPGTGAVFTLALPYRATENRVADVSALFPAVLQAGEQKQELIQVLLVEDDTELRNFMTYSLQERFDIVPAIDATTGLRLAIEHLPDVVVSDIGLAGDEDGIGLCRELKKNPLTCHIPVLMLTARTSFESKKASLEAGSEGYLTKPFSLEELELTIRSLLENRRLLQEKSLRNLYALPQENSIAAPLFSDPFLQDAISRIHENLEDSKFGVEELAQSMRISRVQLFKKIKTLTSLPPADLLRNIRLEKARQMLRKGEGNVSQAAYSTGFDNPNYFSKAFKKHFGISPSEIPPDETS